MNKWDILQSSDQIFQRVKMGTTDTSLSWGAAVRRPGEVGSLTCLDALGWLLTVLIIYNFPEKKRKCNKFY